MHSPRTTINSPREVSVRIRHCCPNCERAVKDDTKRTLESEAVVKVVMLELDTLSSLQGVCGDRSLHRKILCSGLGGIRVHNMHRLVVHAIGQVGWLNVLVHGANALGGCQDGRGGGRGGRRGGGRGRGRGDERGVS